MRYSQVLDTANAGVLLEESESSRQALSGDIFDIRMPLAKTLRIMIIDLQYALISTQTLSGTTESPELLKKKPDDPDDGISSSQSPEKETLETADPVTAKRKAPPTSLRIGSSI